jgi:hypothetical protein
MTHSASKSFHKGTDLYIINTSSRLDESPSRDRDILVDSGIGMHPYIPSTFNSSRLRNGTEDRISFRTPSPKLFDVKSMPRASSSSSKILTTPQRGERVEEGYISDKEQDTRPKGPVAKTKEFPSRNSPKAKLTTSHPTSRSGSLITSVISSEDQEIDPFASRPKIPRGDCAFSVIESPSSTWDSNPLAPIHFLQPLRHHEDQDADSSSSSENFSYGAWGSGDKERSPRSKAIARKIAIEGMVGRNRAMKQKQKEGKSKVKEVVGRNRSEESLISFPSLVEENTADSSLRPTISGRIAFYPQSNGEDRNRLNPFSRNRFSTRRIRRISGSMMSEHVNAYSPPGPPPKHSPRPRQTLQSQGRPLPPLPPLREGEEEGEGAKTVRTSFMVPRGSSWVLFIDGVRAAGVGRVSLDVESTNAHANTSGSASASASASTSASTLRPGRALAPREGHGDFQLSHVTYDGCAIEDLTRMPNIGGTVAIDSCCESSSGPSKPGVKGQRLGFRKRAGTLFRKVLGRKKKV